ncbi:MAG: hypothetical protein IJD16_05490 [Desulfovibrio sp.]|nr:hypothetical protein [Desulfovibrio sp.]
MKNCIFDEITFYEYDQFIKNINNKRENIHSVDKTWLEKVNPSFDFNNISCKKIKNGRTCITYNGLRIEIFLKIHSKKKLLVTFDGARSITHDGDWPPKFVRWSYDNVFDGSILCFEDPMYYKFPNLSL